MAASYARLQPADRDRILALIRAYATEDGQDFVPANATAAVDAILAGDPLGHIWLVQLDGACVGYVCVTRGFSLETGGGDYFLDEIYLVPEARGRGFGRATMAFAEAEARAMGAHRMCLEVEAHNRDAARLYDRLGYRGHARALKSKWLVERT